MRSLQDKPVIPSLPTGTVTFLFTDIEGSTKLAREQSQMWESLRARHDTVLRDAIESNYGFAFQVIGDPFCAAFHTVGDALRAAVRSQMDLYSEDWGNASIKVRIGIHRGKAEIQDSMEYRGCLTLSCVQLVVSIAYGGQVLLANIFFVDPCVPQGMTGSPVVGIKYDRLKLLGVYSDRSMKEFSAPAGLVYTACLLKQLIGLS